MTISQMLQQSAILTGLGMCVVFGFLAIMILSMVLLHSVIHGLGFDKDKADKNTSSSSAASPSAPAAVNDNGAVIAAIACAVHEKEAE